MVRYAGGRSDDQRTRPSQCNKVFVTVDPLNTIKERRSYNHRREHMRSSNGEERTTDVATTTSLWVIPTTDFCNV